jgi:hypothetical protein
MSKIKTGWNRPITFSTNSNFSISAKSQSAIITHDEALKETKDYKDVTDILNKLISTGLTKMGEGYCISVSDIVYNLLSQNKIKCHLAEVQLSVVNKITTETHMIGYETTYQQNSAQRVSTHVVVITDTEIPMLIDMSIAHRLPAGYQAVVAKAEDFGSKVLTTFDFKDYGFIYQEKKEGISVPSLHQVSILDRIATDQKIFQEIKHLKTLNYIGISVSIFALINVVFKAFGIF